LDIFDILALIGGISLFLFGMDLMGTGLEKRAGRQLKSVLARMTSSPLKGFLLGLAVTAIIQSSAATTVMVVGFVNSGVMVLKQAIGVIMGANLGTTVTAWILSLTGIQGDSLIVNLLKPTSFVPILALIGVIMYMFLKDKKKKDLGLIFLGFSVLMFGMDAMTSSMEGLKNVPEFAQMIVLFQNPFLGVLAGAVITALIQSSSASVGILQALTMTGSIPYSTAIPIIMGQNIGTCITALLSAIGATTNAKRAAFVHLFFNLIGTVIFLALFLIVNKLFDIAVFSQFATPFGIAVAHSIFNVLTTALLMPFSNLLEKLVTAVVRNSPKEEKIIFLDERLLATPSVALEQCRKGAVEMAKLSVEALRMSLNMFSNYNEKEEELIREYENDCDKYEDTLGTYLVRISSQQLSIEDSTEVTKLLHMIGDYERISDHAVNMLESAEEVRSKKLSFSNAATRELNVMMDAVREILGYAYNAFSENKYDEAIMVEPLEQVVDKLAIDVKREHIIRLQKSECSIELGFVLADIINNLKRVSDHCSNIAGCILELSHDSMDMHEYLRGVKSGDSEYDDYYKYFSMKYSI
jgi:phosphate:Na+ symporter